MEELTKLRTFKGLEDYETKLKHRNIIFITSCVRVLGKLLTVYPSLTCTYNHHVLCGDGYTCHTAKYINVKLTDEIKISINNHVDGLGDARLLLCIRGLCYTNSEQVGCCKIYSFERAIISAENVIKLAINPALESFYNTPSPEIKFFNKENKEIFKRKHQTIHTTTRSYVDVAK